MFIAYDSRIYPRLGSLAVFLLCFCASAVDAHFVWLAIPSSGSTESTTASRVARLNFAEAPGESSELLPETIQTAEVWTRNMNGARKRAETTVHAGEGEDDSRLEISLPAEQSIAVEAACFFGQHKNFLLHYHAKAIEFSGPGDLKSLGRTPEFPLDLVPTLDASRLTIRLLKGNDAVADVEISVTYPDDHTAKRNTDANGEVTLTDVTPGRYAFRAYLAEALAGNSPPPVSSTSDAAADTPPPATETRRYITLTLTVPGDSEPSAAKRSATATPLGLPPAPELSLVEAVASFGAAVDNGWLYVYGGHTGDAHAHSKENLSRSFRRVPLSGEGDWEELPMQTPLQGHALVAHAGRLYRVGGMTARNAPGEDDDLHSVREVAQFDPVARTWTSLPDLPEGRSSHDAVVVNDQLIVIGGWTLAGADEGKWLSTVWSLNLNHPQEGWKPLPDAPFQKRALGVAARNGRIFAIGGMNSDEEIDGRVFVYDINMSHWTPGPEFPGDGMSAFGVSAWTQGDRVYAAGMEGVLYRLDGGESRWAKVGAVRTPRFFHRLLPFSGERLMLVGGATSQGHITEIETIPVTP